MLRVADLTLDEDAMRVRRGGSDMVLSPTEFRLLACLMRNAGQVLTKQQLLARVWDDTVGEESRVVDSYISHLRRKIDAAGKRRSAREQLLGAARRTAARHRAVRRSGHRHPASAGRTGDGRARTHRRSTRRHHDAEPGRDRLVRRLPAGALDNHIAVAKAGRPAKLLVGPWSHMREPPQTATTMRPARQRILHAASRASRIVLPVVPGQA